MKSKHLSVFAGLAVLSALVGAEEMKFGYTLPGQQNICFLQNIAENIQGKKWKATLLNLTLTIKLIAVTEVNHIDGPNGPLQSLQLTVNDPKGRQLTMLENNPSLRYSFTTYVGGNYQICILNKEREVANFEFMIQTGVEAKDYSNIITKKHLRPIEVQAQKV